MRKLFFILPLLVCRLSLWAQFAPPAGQPGTTAIYKDSSAIAGWANGCTIQRGLQDISNAAGGYASAGDSSLAIGPAGINGTVSLGDSGVAILTFNPPITDGAGSDIAVFENGFSDSFLELGFVEVSSDGVNFFRFPATCNVQDTTQTSGFGLTDATLVNNFAGKYRANYGTPFDLQEMSGQAGLDISQITHVKIVDVVGNIGAYASNDAYGHKVNDPWPTPFASSGFDLDAVAALHLAPVGIKESGRALIYNFYPNPTHDQLYISIPGVAENTNIRILSATGITAMETIATATSVKLDISGLAAGVYFIEVSNSTKKSIQKLVIQ
jgi:hypothetical protein